MMEFVLSDINGHEVFIGQLSDLSHYLQTTGAWYLTQLPFSWEGRLDVVCLFGYLNGGEFLNLDPEATRLFLQSLY